MGRDTAVIRRAFRFVAKGQTRYRRVRAALLVVLGLLVAFILIITFIKTHLLLSGEIVMGTVVSPTSHEPPPQSVKGSRHTTGFSESNSTLSSPSVNPHSTHFMDPYDPIYLLSLVDTQGAPEYFSYLGARNLSAGVAYYIPKGSTAMAQRKKRIMMYRSLPHPACVAALLLRHYNDLYPPSDNAARMRNNWRKGPVKHERGQYQWRQDHDLKMPDGGRTFPFLTETNNSDKNNSEAVRRLFSLFQQSGVESRVIRKCRKVSAAFPGALRHPREAVFFDISNVFYAGGRFILFADDDEDDISTHHNKSDNDEMRKMRENESKKKRENNPLESGRHPSAATLPQLRRESLTDTEANAALDESILPAAALYYQRPLSQNSTVAHRQARETYVRRISKVTLSFGTMFPFVSKSWPQSSRSTLPLFIAVVSHTARAGPQAQSLFPSFSDKAPERYRVGYFQPPTDFQTPHHMVVETIIPSLLAQRHYLRAQRDDENNNEEEEEEKRENNNEALRAKRKTHAGDVLALTSRPYFTYSYFKPDGCRVAKEKCLYNGPWGDMYMAQLQHLAETLRQRRVQGPQSDKNVSSDEASLRMAGLAPETDVVYGLRANETQFEYIRSESRRRRKGKGKSVVQVDRLVVWERQEMHRVFRLDRLLVGTPLHCEPLGGSDALYADIVHTYFRHMHVNSSGGSGKSYNGVRNILFESLLAQLAQSGHAAEGAGPFRHMWERWVALFYISYEDCLSHLALFRRMHLTRMFALLMHEKRRLVVRHSGDNDNNITNNISRSVSDPLVFLGSTNTTTNHSGTKNNDTESDRNDDGLVEYLRQAVQRNGAQVDTAAKQFIRMSDAMGLILNGPVRALRTTNGTQSEAAAATKDHLMVHIFYSSRRGNWARDVVNDESFIPKLVHDVESHFNSPGVRDDEKRRVHLRMMRFNGSLSLARQVFTQMEVHRTTVFIGAPGANLLLSAFLRPPAGVVTFSWWPTVDKVFYSMPLFPRYSGSSSGNNNNNSDSDGRMCDGGDGLLWRSVALRQTCNRRLRRRRCIWGNDNTNDLMITPVEYHRILTAVIQIVKAQDRLRSGGLQGQGTGIVAITFAGKMLRISVGRLMSVSPGAFSFTKRMDELKSDPSCALSGPEYALLREKLQVYRGLQNTYAVKQDDVERAKRAAHYSGLEFTAKPQRKPVA